MCMFGNRQGAGICFSKLVGGGGRGEGGMREGRQENVPGKGAAP